MKAVVVTRPGKVEIFERGPGPIGPGEARVVVEAVGVCGSDLALWTGKHPYAAYPVVPGHEVAGRVVETGSGVDIAVGQPVALRPLVTCGTCRACREARPNHCAQLRVLGVHLDGGMAEEMVVAADSLYAVPEDMSAEVAALVEPTAVAVHVCRRAGVGPGTTMAIVGTGVIGLLALQVARAWGARPLLGVDRLGNRLEVARQLGVGRVVSPVEEDVRSVCQDICPEGFDVVLDSVGIAETFLLDLAIARQGGTIVPIALPHGQVDFDFEPVYRKELTLRATRLYDEDFAQAIPLLASGDVSVAQLITHRLPLHEAERALALAGEHPDEAIKVVLTAASRSQPSGAG